MAEPQQDRPQFDFTSAPSIGRFMQRPEFVRMLIGPLGSGKTTGCVVECMTIANSQDVDPSGYKRSRIAIIRNTSPELRSTTIKSWLDYWPPQRVGADLRYSSPITHHIVIPPRGNYPGLDAEFLFVPLDKPSDVKKLLSLQLTAAYINETSEMPRAIVQMLRGRVGRYPAFNKQTGYGPRRVGIFGDTNPPDEDHWLATMDLHERPEGWSFDRQPPAVLEVEPIDTREVDGRLIGTAKCIDAEYRDCRFEKTRIVRAADRHWIVNPDAENLPNLIPGYYTDQQLPGARLDWVRRYLQARYGFVQEGKPVIPDYVDEVYAFDELPVIEDEPIILGMDVGGGTLAPAAVFGQRHPRGTWLIHAEVVLQDFGLRRFADEIIRVAHLLFPGKEVQVAWGDPAGVKRDELFEVAAFDHLRSRGIPAQPAPSNSISLRVEAITAAVTRFIDGKPGMMINRTRCPKLRKGLAGGWHYKRVQVVGEDRYHSTPVKNDYSHPCDALGYLTLGGGEAQSLRFGDQQPFTEPAVANVDFDVFGGGDAW